MDRLRYVVLLGKVGHGKTRLLNSLTDSTYTSSAAASSCTRTLQLGRIPGTDVIVVDTPGFYSSEDVAGHVNTQMEAFGRPVSGVYIVVRFGAPSEMAEVANRMMDFTGEEDVRVICTHVDTVERETGFDGHQVAVQLSELLDIPKENIAMVGKNTDSFVIKAFIFDTLHQARQIQVSSEQRAVVTSLSGLGSRKFNKEIDELAGILREHSLVLDSVEDKLSNGEVKTFARSLLIRKAKGDFDGGCSELLSRAKELLPNEEYDVSKKLDHLKATTWKLFTEKYKQPAKKVKETGYHKSGGGRRGRQGRSRGKGRGYRDGLYEYDAYARHQKHYSMPTNNEEDHSIQPANQATKDLETALCAFLLDYCGSSKDQPPVHQNDPSSWNNMGSCTQQICQDPKPANVSPLSSMGYGEALKDSMSSEGNSEMIPPPTVTNTFPWHSVQKEFEWEESPKLKSSSSCPDASFVQQPEDLQVRGSPYQTDSDVDMGEQHAIWESRSAWLPVFRSGGLFHLCLE